ncbi:uncharacterized protein LOC117560805 [Gymnodraco acuticeps]|uniref:Uncharacterized protein LOC117560805 n=1 Tax=Gymnodraco acuticeps TaxID=8218 RepID=A0A6P8W592_GYMAC|nr:uncharacterized protein LOC117560805 [Gymnodraco acuticeps]
MTVQLSFLLIFTGLTGIHSITTVSKVSVRAEGSITIPCLYESQYINNVKYLCKGYLWNFCSDKVNTNKPSSSGKFSISDDKKQRVFTVTINDLTEEDTGYYWCGVEINGGYDSGTDFHLSVTGGTPYLYVDEQKRTGFRGEEITINYHYHNVGDIKWCRLGSSCVTWPNGSLDNSTVTIKIIDYQVLTVTMSGLRTESSVWYWCVKGDLQMPVHITVTEKQQQSVSGNLKNFIIPLSLLIFIVMVAIFIWFIFKKHRQTKEESPATIILGLAEEEVTYSDVKHMRRASEKWSEANRDVDVMYSSVVAVERQTKQRILSLRRRSGDLGRSPCSCRRAILTPLLFAPLSALPPLRLLRGLRVLSLLPLLSLRPFVPKPASVTPYVICLLCRRFHSLHHASTEDIIFDRSEISTMKFDSNAILFAAADA